VGLATIAEEKPVDTQVGNIASAENDQAGLVITSDGRPIARYTSGLTIYEETLAGGRWIGRYWQAAGFVETEQRLTWVEDNAHTPKDIAGLDLGSMTPADAGRPGCKHAIVLLRSTLRPVTVQVHTVVDGTGFLERWLSITNAGERSLALGAVWPWSGLLARVKDWAALMGGETPVFSVGYMTERMWGLEGGLGWQPLPSTPLRIESRLGKSGHGTPFFVVHNEASGEHLVGGLAWSGNWAIDLTAEQLAGPDAFLAFRMGPVAPTPQRTIAPGETVETPHAHLGMLQADFDGAIQAWHRHLRRSVLQPEVPNREGLVVYNNWSYNQHEVTEDNLKFEIDVGAEIGAEVFLIDAGWYGDREADWWATVGDWAVGNRLPNGLEPIREYARQKGLLFGLWLDLERMGAESKVAREHPEWFLVRYGQRTRTGDMDLTNPAALAYIEEALCRVIDRYDLDLFRLDYNTSPYEGGQVLRDGYMENTIWRYYENVYAMYDRIRTRYPLLIMENCAGGGGRTDLGLVSRFHHTQVSDCHLVPRHVRIANGMSIALPPERVDTGSGVREYAHIRGDLDMQCRACMFGHFCISGLYPRRGEQNAEQIARVRHHVEVYRRSIRPLLAQGRMYHHTPALVGKEPQGWAIWECVAESKATAAVGIFRLGGPSAATYHLRLRGVDLGRNYRVTFDNSGEEALVSGLSLKHDGLTVRLARPLTSELLLIEQVG
jgi:alpha-galactosidase